MGFARLGGLEELMEGAHLLSHCTSPWRVGLELGTTRLRPPPKKRPKTSRD